MRRRIAFLILAIAMAVPALAAVELQPRDLTPVTWLKAPAHPPVEIVRDRQARAVVYLADAKPSPRLKRLVAELVQVVRASTGAALEQVAQAPAADRPAIVIGDCEESRKAGIDAANISVEGFVVKTAPGRVFLVGSTEALPGGTGRWAVWINDGTAWAVADFLERFVGVRWYWPTDLGGRCIVPAQTLVVPPVHYRDQPVFRQRTFHPQEGWRLPTKARWFDKQPLPFAPGAIPDGVKLIDMPDYLPLVRDGNSWPYVVKVHEPQRFRQSKSPEWLQAHKNMFELKADGSRNWGMFCYSAQETFDYLLAGCERTWGKTGADSWVTSTCVTISPGDSAVTCHCAECRKTMGPGGSATGASRVMGLFVKRMCEEVKRRWPDKKVIFLPYWNYQACPKDVEFPDNLTVMVCGVGSPMALRCKAGRRRAAEDNLRAWKAAVGGNPITNWDYSDRGSGWTHGPIQYPRLVRDFYQTNRGSLAGTFINGGIASDWTTSAPTLYVWMRVLWNPDVDVDALLDEMCRRLYGPAAGTVRELIEVQCRWETGPWSHNLPDAGRIPPEVFRQVWPAEVVAQMKALRDKALLEVANDPVARQRFLYWTWTFDAFLKDAEEIHDKTP